MPFIPTYYTATFSSGRCVETSFTPGEHAAAPANARLIAAAPDLLIALRDLLDDLQMDMLTAPAGSFRMIKSGRRIEQAHAAIAKATGEV